VVAAHIHVAPPGDPGPIVVPLFEGAFAGTDSASGCVEDVDAGLIKDIRQDPAAYYVNVHSTPGFEGGAIRGQLGD
jgi:CHRD domain